MYTKTYTHIHTHWMSLFLVKKFNLYLKTFHKETPTLDYFPSEFYQIFVEEIKSVLNKIFHKIDGGKYL